MQIRNFKPIEIEDREIFKLFFLEDPPMCSELTFTNLFIWQHLYNPVWLEWEDNLLIILKPDSKDPFGLQPIGTGQKEKALEILFGCLNELTVSPSIRRVSENFVNEYVDFNRYTTIFDRDNSDYVYRTRDLIELEGRKYHRKKNLLNKFMKNYRSVYRELDIELVECFMDMQESWCLLKNCLDTPDLLSEDYAVHVALKYLEELDYQGGAIQIDFKIEAFSLGEVLNPNTAVIHIEKANPDIPGLYSAINQLFCSHAWNHIEYINREQDLGVEGLRQAKESYYPHHMVNKYTIRQK